MSLSMSSSATNRRHHHHSGSSSVAIIGGGITGSSAASVFCSIGLSPSERASVAPATKQLLPDENNGATIQVHLFDQGRNGPGGRASHRRVEVMKEETTTTTTISKNKTHLRFDHGCQFFRADTEPFRSVVQTWMENGMAQEWKGEFVVEDCDDNDDETTLVDHNSFFGLPSHPPFYVGSNGMQSIPKSILAQHMKKKIGDDNDATLQVFEGTRVTRIERSATNNRWYLFGVGGDAAYHDTAGKGRNVNNDERPLGNIEGYEAILMTDVSSSSVGKWHRAGIEGVPTDFATMVQDRVGARVPLFTAMVTYDRPLTEVSWDAASFVKNDVLWFAAKMNSKPGMSDMEKECWTLVSTPGYAMQKIRETPMQDPTTGEFIPQNKDYLTTVPGPELEKAFREAITGKPCGKNEVFPKVEYLNAQRWGSALPAHGKQGDNSSLSSSRQAISNLVYDSKRAPLAPTRQILENNASNNLQNFVSSERWMLFQAGDMMSCYTPGFESAALSGMDAAEYILGQLQAMRHEE